MRILYQDEATAGVGHNSKLAAAHFGRDPASRSQKLLRHRSGQQLPAILRIGGHGGSCTRPVAVLQTAALLLRHVAVNDSEHLIVTHQERQETIEQTRSTSPRGRDGTRVLYHNLG